MAKKKIENKDIIAENLFIPATQNAETLLGVLDKLDAGFKNIASRS